jgi:hypothetical protein
MTARETSKLIGKTVTIKFPSGEFTYTITGKRKGKNLAETTGGGLLQMVDATVVRIH